MSDADFMCEAIREAERALSEGETPVGCVIVKDGEIVARAHNEREKTHDPTAHAELLAIRRAAREDWRLAGATMYVTLEPCPMCAGAVSLSRIGRLVFGAPDPKAGCAGSVYRIPEDPAFSHFCRCEGGLLADECAALIGSFFKRRREK
jgi:tRNA(adenine34) deaminase